MEYLATFFTHSGAIKYQKYLKKIDIEAQLMPVPRKLSSNCGIAAKYVFQGDIRKIISEDIEKLFEIQDKETKLIYSATE